MQEYVSSGRVRVGVLPLHRPMIQERLQNQYGSEPIHRPGAFLDADVGFPQHSPCLHRRQALIPAMHGQPELLLQVLSECFDMAGLRARHAAHPQRITDHNFSHRVVGDHLRQVLEVGPLVLSLQGLDTLGGDTQQVRYRQANAPSAYIHGQQSARQHVIQGGHAPIIGVPAVQDCISMLGASFRWRQIQPSFRNKQTTKVPGSRKSRRRNRAALSRRGWSLLPQSAWPTNAPRLLSGSSRSSRLLAGLYFGKLVLVVILVSVLLAFVLAPLVDLLARIRVPNWAGALISVLLFCAALYGLANVSYNKAVSFMEQLPRYRGEIQSLTWKLRQKEQMFEKNANQVLPTPKTPGAKMVQVQQQPDWTGALTNSLGTASELALAASFVPFLAYFMLSWQEHVRSATIMLFSREERSTAYATLGAIVKMVRAFIVGNLIVGLLLSGASTAAFGFLHLPYFYFLGVISGFLSLVPYLGPLLAVVPPFLSGLGVIHGTGFVVILLTVFGLHIFAMNVLYPKFLGSRLQLNPLAVTLALLFWGWLWGAMGLVLAIPMTAAIKIICDHVPRYRAVGLWLGE